MAATIIDSRIFGNIFSTDTATVLLIRDGLALVEARRRPAAAMTRWHPSSPSGCRSVSNSQ